MLLKLFPAGTREPCMFLSECQGFCCFPSNAFRHEGCGSWGQCQLAGPQLMCCLQCVTGWQSPFKTIHEPLWFSALGTCPKGHCRSLCQGSGRLPDALVWLGLGTRVSRVPSTQVPAHHSLLLVWQREESLVGTERPEKR